MGTAAALGVALVLGALLARSSPVTAQPAPSPTADPEYFPATGFRISVPAFWAYFQARGGVRTFGYPVSNDFPLLGKRVQIFQRGVLQQRPDGSIGAADLLDGSYAPFTHVGGLTLPKRDPALLSAAPHAGDPDYLASALAFIDQVVPDEWNGLPVDFAATYAGTASCLDLAELGEECDATLLPGFAVEVWGLPTSAPQRDPNNDDFVYQRFERGVLHYSATTGQTQWLLMGDWFKHVLAGTDLPPDLASEAAGSRFFGQLANGRPLGLARPADLPDTSLASAFVSAGDLTSAQQPFTTVTPTLQTATAIGLLTATAVTEANIQTAVAATLTATAGGATASATSASATATALAAAQALVPGQQPGVGQPMVAPGGFVPTPSAALTPATNVGCLGDEQMFFVPRKPFIGTRVQVSVTSARRHNALIMALTGPVDTGAPTERLGLYGWVWTWTVTPSVEAFYQFTFYADGLHPCNTSGFNAYIPLGSTPTATPTNEPTATNGPTETPTPAVPNVAAIQPPAGDCSATIDVLGSNFGTPPSGQTTPSGAQVFFGGKQATIINWTNTSILFGIPSGAPSGPNSITVSVPGGGFSQSAKPFVLTVPPPANSTPIPGTPTAGSCP